jgi:type VI secretion system protein ImpA
VRDLPAVADPLAFLEDARYCQAALEQLQAAVDGRLGADGPAFGPARDAVQKAVDDAVLKAPSFNTSAGAGSALASGEDSLAARMVCVADGAEGPGGWPTMPHSRAQALAQLRLVAEFFRRAEPHSPVAYLADKAAQWGELPLHEWLRTVVKDPAQIAQLDELLGAAPPG